MFVKEFERLGSGASKQAFTIEEDITGERHNFTIPVGGDVTKFCIVKYTNPIQWRSDSTFMPKFIEFRTQMMSDPKFKRDVYNNLISQTNQFVLYNRLYNIYKNQFECVAELKKMMALGDAFAPKLHQIRIDIVGQEQGTPFSPEEMDSQFEETGNNKVVNISYLVERCDDSVIKFVSENIERKNEVATKMIEFVDSYVETQNELNCDIKSENFCPRIVDGRVVSIRLLDVDPKFCIKGETPDFKQNAKVFMKYAFITHSAKWGQTISRQRVRINFGNMGITQHEVDAAIRFFYKPEYMVYEFNPINMLYHYFVNLHPGNFVSLPAPNGWKKKISKTGKNYYVSIISDPPISQWKYPEDYIFLYYDNLIKYFKDDFSEIIKIFQDANMENGVVLLSEGRNTKQRDSVGPSESGGGGGPFEDSKEGAVAGPIEDTTDNAQYKEEDAKGGKRKRKSKKRKNMKKKRTRKV